MPHDSPFAPVSPRQSFLETREAGEILSRLDQGLGAREPFLLVTGEPGVGKTALAHELIARWGSRVTTAFLAYPALTGAELLEEIVHRFGGEPPDGASRPKLIACLERAIADIAGRGQVAMIVVDDAQNLPPERLEELGLLVNAAQQKGQPLEVLLLGPKSLEARLDHPSLASLHQRISVRAKLGPLSSGEARRYIRHRVAAAGGDGPGLFPRPTCLDIAELAGGVPRRINALASEALRLARAAGQSAVLSDHAQAAAASLRGAVASRPAVDLDEDEEDSPEEVTRALKAVAASTPPVAREIAPPVVAQSTPAAAPAPRPETKSAPPPAPAPRAETKSTPPAAPAPRAETKSTPPAAPASASAPTPQPTPAASQDSREWVKRFVGDKGPLQIGSRAVAESSWTPEITETGDTKPPDPTEKVRPRKSPPVEGLSHTRSKRTRVVNLAIAAVMAASVVIVAIMVIIRVGGQGRSGAGRVASVAMPDSLLQSAERASSARAQKPSKRAAQSASTASGREHVVVVPDANWRGPYTIEVGGDEDLQRALDERDRVQMLTGIQSWVAAPAEGEGPNRIVVGMFRSRERAQGAASMLLRSRTLHRAAVVPMPPPSTRQ